MAKKFNAYTPPGFQVDLGKGEKTVPPTKGTKPHEDEKSAFDTKTDLTQRRGDAEKSDTDEDTK